MSCSGLIEADDDNDDDGLVLVLDLFAERGKYRGLLSVFFVWVFTIVFKRVEVGNSHARARVRVCVCVCVCVCVGPTLLSLI